MINEKKLSLRAELDGEVLQLFEHLKETHNFKTNSECIRWCITEAAKKTDLQLENEYVEMIDAMLNNPIIKQKFLVFNRNEFIRKALGHFIEHIRKNTPSIQNWDVRSQLPENELEIAIAVIKCQSESATEMVTVEDVLSALGRKNYATVRECLEKFVSQGILNKTLYKGQEYYHAKKY